MKNFNSRIKTVGLSLIMSLSIITYSERAQALLSIGVRGGEEEMQCWEKLLPSGQMQKLESDTVEFDNQNTFVRITDSEHSISGQDVVMVIPQKINSNQLMEALQKVKVLKFHGAKNIMIKVMEKDMASAKQPQSLGLNQVQLLAEDGKENFTHLSLPELFNVAGAQAQITDRVIPLDNPSQQSHRPQPQQSQQLQFYIAGETHPQLAAELVESTGGISLSPSQQSPNLQGSTVYLVGAPALKTQAGEKNVNDNIFKMLDELSAYRQQGAEVQVISGYYPYARSDKANDQKNGAKIAVYASLTASLFEQMGAQSMTWVRAHAAQTQGFFKNIPAYDLSGRPTIVRYLKEMKVQRIIAPDAGAQKDDTLYANALGLPISVANKQRNPLTYESHLVGLDCSSMKGEVVAIIDDETATGGTLAEVAEYLKKDCQVDKVFAVVTHLAGPGTKALKGQWIDQLVVTNTLPTPSSLRESAQLKVLSLKSELGDHILAQEKMRKQKLEVPSTDKTLAAFFQTLSHIDSLNVGSAGSTCSQE